MCGCVPRMMNENKLERTMTGETGKGITRHASFLQKSCFLVFHLKQGIMCLLGIAEKLDLGLHNIYPLIWQTYSSTSDLKVRSIFYQVPLNNIHFKSNQTKP